MNWLKGYIKWKMDGQWKWVDKNPRKAAWIAWLKGLITGLLIYYFFLK